MPPCTTKTRTTNLKIKNNQNCQKIKLYGSLTTKELKKKHSSRPAEGVETGSQGERMCGKVVARAPHGPSYVQIAGKNNRGAREIHRAQGSSARK